METNLRLTGRLMGMIMAQTFGSQLARQEPAVVVVEVAGIRAADQPDAAPSERSLTVRFQLGPATSVSADAGAAP